MLKKYIKILLQRFDDEQAQLICDIVGTLITQVISHHQNISNIKKMERVLQIDIVKMFLYKWQLLIQKSYLQENLNTNNDVQHQLVFFSVSQKKQFR
ncbi:unnamed protein product (macronuclear) [Paramecium tetraurelia]|uniref:Uncharacterized protein n=1 Tax=Paramecium tetraurelia TaxID=5888 RepID=A0CJ92_PARTE|nr:uncharacterized protein GSPATT00000568001 [Paramecium tetraurelia]CAK70859.1 unnamed protein product [Paramecium tetraurelia]|eukprot:XP_001438256.1 hypothetical protein (macronuclear) [Paramecium tetraurelia strain d4-2]